MRCSEDGWPGEDDELDDVGDEGQEGEHLHPAAAVLPLVLYLKLINPFIHVVLSQLTNLSPVS